MGASIAAQQREVEPASILVYSGLELIGDGLLKLPFLRALRQAWPTARVTWAAGLGRSVFAGTLSEVVQPYIDEVIECAGIGEGWAELRRRPLDGRRFDLVIDTQRRVRTTLLLRRVRHGRFVSGAAGFWLSRPLPARRPGKAEHMTGAMMRLLEVASGRPPAFDRTLSLPPRFETAAAEALPGGPYVGFAPGAGGQHKRWPLPRFLEVACAMHARGYRPVFLLGPDEAEWATAIAADCPSAVTPLQSGTELARSPLFTMACARRLAAAVANDSGTGHMLAAADTRLLSLFGPTDPRKFAPFVTVGGTLRAQQFGGSDMAAIPADAVIAELLRLLAADD